MPWGIAQQVNPSNIEAIEQAIRDIGYANILTGLLDPTTGLPMNLTFKGWKFCDGPEPQEIINAQTATSSDGTPFLAIRRPIRIDYADAQEANTGMQFSREMTGERLLAHDFIIYVVTKFSPLTASSYDYPLARRIWRNMEALYVQYHMLPDGSGAPTCETTRIFAPPIEPIKPQMIGDNGYFVISLGVRAIEAATAIY